MCFRIGDRSSEEQPRDSVQSVMSATSPGFRKAADLADSEIGIMSPESRSQRQLSLQPPCLFPIGDRAWREVRRGENGSTYMEHPLPFGICLESVLMWQYYTGS